MNCDAMLVESTMKVVVHFTEKTFIAKRDKIKNLEEKCTCNDV